MCIRDSFDVLEYKALNCESQPAKRTNNRRKFRVFSLALAQSDGLTGGKRRTILLQYFFAMPGAGFRRRDTEYRFGKRLHAAVRGFGRGEQSNTGDTADRSREVSPLTREGLFTPSGPPHGAGEEGAAGPQVSPFCFSGRDRARVC